MKKDPQRKNRMELSAYKLILGLVKKFATGKNLSILDAGCGTGGLMARLNKIGKTIGVDVSDDGLRLARKRGVVVVKASVDRFVHNARRYTKDELERKMVRAGLSTKFVSYVHAPIFLMSLARVLFEKIARSKKHSTIGKVGLGLNRLATWILNKEADLILSGVRLPFGQALVGVAVKE